MGSTIKINAAIYRRTKIDKPLWVGNRLKLVCNEGRLNIGALLFSRLHRGVNFDRKSLVFTCFHLTISDIDIVGSPFEKTLNDARKITICRKLSFSYFLVS